MAVPGGVLAKRNRGGHTLVRDKAKVLEAADDILKETAEGHPYAVTGINEPSQDQDGTDSLLRDMDAGQYHGLDALAAFSGLNTAEIFSKLVDFKV